MQTVPSLRRMEQTWALTDLGIISLNIPPFLLDNTAADEPDSSLLRCLQRRASSARRQPDVMYLRVFPAFLHSISRILGTEPYSFI